jgi:Peptidase A4 family
MRKLPSARLLRIPAMGAIVAAATCLAAAPVAAGVPGAGFAPHTWGGPLTDAGNWAGYAASGGSYTTITATWTEPKATCQTRSPLYAPWIGLDGYGDQTVEQTGVQTACSTGKPVESGWYEMYPAAPVYYSNPVSIGDTISATVTFEGGNSYQLTLSDTTKGWTHTVTKSLSASNASAEAIIEAPGGFPRLPNGVTFDGVTVDGKLLNTYSPAKLTSAGFVPGPLSGGTFTITHK